MTILQKIRSLLTRRDKKILLGIGIVTILVSVLEVANLSFIMLFISIITNFKALPSNKYVLSLQKQTGVLTNSQIIFLFGGFLIAFFGIIVDTALGNLVFRALIGAEYGNLVTVIIYMIFIPMGLIIYYRSIRY